MGGVRVVYSVFGSIFFCVFGIGFVIFGDFGIFFILFGVMIFLYFIE